MTRRLPTLLALLLLSLPVPVRGANQLASQATTAPAPAAPAIGSVEERRVLASLEQARQDLAKQQAAQQQKALELQTLSQEVDRKLDALKTVRDQLDKLLKAKDDAEVQRIGDLSKMYEKMDPAKAAVLLASLDRDLAVSILGGIKAKIAGKILNNMNSETAARFTRAYSTLARD